MRHGEHITGYEVYHSPEFRALCEKFGIAYGLPTKSVTLTLTEERFIVQQEYDGRVGVEPPGYIDTTNLHNEHWRTGVPPVPPTPDHEVGRLHP